MKFKDLETALKYFYPIVKDSDSPFKNADWEDDNLDLENLKKEEEIFKKDNFIIQDNYNCLSGFAYNYLIYTIGHSKRGQFYYILCEKSTLELHILASEPDGDGGMIMLPDILLNLIKNGDII